MDKNFENFLANFSFLILFISMLMYWTQASNFETNSTKETLLKNKQTNFSFLEKLPFSFNNKDRGRSIATITTMIANGALFLLLVLRWKESGHFPLSNLYESLMFLSWSLTLIHLIIEIGFSSSIHEFDLNKGSALKNELIIDQRKAFIATRLIGSITAPSALFTNAFATFSLPKEMQEAAPLVPALQSNWLMMHVTIMILSYAALILGSLLSIGFLVITGGENIKLDSNSNSKNIILATKLSDFADAKSLDFNPKIVRSLNNDSSKMSSLVGFNSLENNIIADTTATNINLNLNNQIQEINYKASYRLNLAKTLDNLSYRVLGLGFPLLTIGILSGAVWANEAWGSYWSWDPKETWALLTWLVFAIYLHTRLTKGWEGKKPALIASLGFVTVWICFLGVNLIGEGLHSYGWMAQS